MTLIMITALLLMGRTGVAQDTLPDMKTYQMVFLKSGPNRGTSAMNAEQTQQAHLAYLAKLNRERINLLYGPFLDGGELRGIAVLDLADAKAAQQLFANDPHVKAGYLLAEVKPWLGPKNLFHPPAQPQAFESFIVGFLVRGANRSQPATEAQQIQRGHLAYLEELRKNGKLVVAGPFLDDSDLRGLLLLRVKTIEEAKELAAQDPAVKAGRLAIEARPWMTLKGILN